MLHSLGLSHLLVEGPPPSTSSWVVHLEEPQSTAGAALALDDYMLSELLDALKVPETCTRLVDHSSQFWIPSNIYPKLFKPLPLDDQVVVTMNNRGMSPNSNITDHRRIVEALLRCSWAHGIRGGTLFS